MQLEGAVTLHKLEMFFLWCPQSGCVTEILWQEQMHAPAILMSGLETQLLIKHFITLKIYTNWL